MSNPTYSSDPADPRDVPAYDPSQGGPETPGYETPAYTTGTPTYTEPAADNPYTTSTGESAYSTTGGRSTKDVAKGEAGAVKDTAVGAGKEVAATAKEQAANVASEAKQQAMGLLSTATSEVRNQASTQQGRVASTVRGYADELQGISQGSAPSGVMGDLIQQAAAKGSDIAQWLEDREPADVLEELRRFARRRPVVFLALCGLAGVVAGRITRGAVAANTSVDSPSPARANYDTSTAPSTGSGGYEQGAPTYGAYSDAPAGYAGGAGWSAESSVPAGYPTQGEPTR